MKTRITRPVMSLLAMLIAFLNGGPLAAADYEHQDTRDLVALVDDAAALVASKGEAAFVDFRVPSSRWRQDDSYIFVLDPQGNMLVHPDPSMEGHNELALTDVGGKPIIRGLIDAVTASPKKTDGWYHYQWPVPGGLIPRWKSSYVKLIASASGKSYVVGSGVYNDRMERSFVVDEVRDAVNRIEKDGAAVFRIFHDPTGPFLVKDTYVFVIDMDGNELVNPAFPNLEGRNLLGLKDTQGKYLVREMINVAQTSGSGWVEYMWPKPGESVSTEKSTYVSIARLGDRLVLVGAGVYLSDAPTMPAVAKMAATELMALVREGAAVLEQKGEAAYPEFRKTPSKWFHDEVYLFVWTMKGLRTFHAASPEGEGQDVSELKDIEERPIGKMFLEAASSPSGEGWVHYLYPEPGNIFPIWKSTFIKRVTFPSGGQYLVGSGIYNMEMDETFIEDVVNRASALVESEGPAEFTTALRDKTSPFLFLDTYVFVERADGTELVNAGQPSLEGKNLMAVKDLNGKPMVRDYIAEAEEKGSAWVDYYWYKPGDNTPARKRTYVKKVQSGGTTYIVGSGFYPK